MHTAEAWRRQVTARDFHFVLHQLTSLRATLRSGYGHLCHMNEDSEAQRARLPPRSESRGPGVASGPSECEACPWNQDMPALLFILSFWMRKAEFLR